MGEKGIGRLAVHKLGFQTVLASRERGSKTEVEVIIDWTIFEDKKDEYLENIPVRWVERAPSVFGEESEVKHGTEIRITRLQRRWTRKMMERLTFNVDAMTSPFAGLKQFKINLSIIDEEKPGTQQQSLLSTFGSATYKFEVEVTQEGKAFGVYSFFRPDLENLKREKQVDMSLLDPTQFPIMSETRKQRTPNCGPFSFRLYAWDLFSGDKKAVFGDTATYELLVRPNTGVRVFRDGFRVLPYGNENDDWLNLDARRVGRFEEHVSRN